MLKQRDYYIYAYLPDTEVFHNLPLSVTAVVFLYLLIFGIFCFWGYRADLAHRKQEQEKDEKYKIERDSIFNKYSHIGLIEIYCNNIKKIGIKFYIY